MIQNKQKNGKRDRSLIYYSRAGLHAYTADIIHALPLLNNVQIKKLCVVLRDRIQQPNTLTIVHMCE